MGLALWYLCSTGKGDGGGKGGQSPGLNSARACAPFRGPPFARLEKEGAGRRSHFGDSKELHDYGGARKT
eukprot:4989205-Lingulodinium_polyedra.AAC.1